MALLAGVMAALALVPLCRPSLPDSPGWTLAALAYLTGTLLGGYLLWASTRRSGPALSSARSLPAWLWLSLAGLALAVGVAAWPAAVEWLDASRGSGARMADQLEAGRWSLGAGLALLLTGLGRLLPSAEPARLAAGAAFVAAAAWLVGNGLGAAAPDVALPAIGLVLPIAAATAAVHALRPTEVP